MIFQSSFFTENRYIWIICKKNNKIMSDSLKLQNETKTRKIVNNITHKSYIIFIED